MRSTAVYRGFDIGTTTVPAGTPGHPHHLIDIVDPTRSTRRPDSPTDAAEANPQYSRAGGCRFWSRYRAYYRALVRWLFFPGLAPTTPAGADPRGGSAGDARLHRNVPRDARPPGASAADRKK